MGVEGYGLGVDVGSRTVTAAVHRGSGAALSADDPAPSARPAGNLPAADSDLVARALSRVGGPPLVAAEGRPVAGEVVVADVVAEVCAATAAGVGVEPAGVAVTVPPSWGDHRRALLHDALEAALGIPTSVVSSAEAVVAAHVADGRLAARTVVAVYDLGASMLDTAVVEVDDRGCVTTRSVPPAPLGWGSRDLDDALVDLVLAGLEPQKADLDAESRFALRAQCTAAKEALALDTVARVELDLPEAGRASVRLTREDLEDLLADPVARTVEVLRSTVSEAGLEPEDLDAVVVAGGCGAAPFVVERLSAELGRPVVLDDAPSGTAARGAARLASGPLPADSAGTEGDPAGADAVPVEPGGDDGAAHPDAEGRSRRRPGRSRPLARPRGVAHRPPTGRPRRVDLRRGAVVLAGVGVLLLIPVTSFDFDGRPGTPAGDPQARAAEAIAGPSPAAADAVGRAARPAEDSSPDPASTASTGTDAGPAAEPAAIPPASTGAPGTDETTKPASTPETTPSPANGSPTGSPTTNPTPSTPTGPPPTTSGPTTPAIEEPTTSPPPAEPPVEPPPETTVEPPSTDPPPVDTEPTEPESGEDTTQQTPPSETTTEQP